MPTCRTTPNPPRPPQARPPASTGWRAGATSALPVLLLLSACGGLAPLAPAAVPDRAALLPAPLPRDASGPAVPQRTELMPATLRSYNGPERGSGFLPGSTYKNLEDTPTTRAGGVRLRVPFQ